MYNKTIMKIIDLTMPIEDHLRWPVERKLNSDFGQGDPFQVTWAGWAVHGFTHMDAPRHMLPDGKTTFWTQAPYMSREAATWLLDQGVKAVAFDFPQDYVIRLLLKNETASMDQFVTHDVLLRNGVILIEYLCNTAALQSERTMLYTLPLKIPPPFLGLRTPQHGYVGR